jgi:hypothetical protein
MFLRMNILTKFAHIKKSLEQERAKVQERLNELNAVLGTESAPTAEAPVRRGPGRPKGVKAKGQMSAAGRARIIAAQKLRWARIKASKGQAATEVSEPPETAVKPKRKISAAGKRAIAAGAKARWAKFRAAKAGKK